MGKNRSTLKSSYPPRSDGNAYCAFSKKLLIIFITFYQLIISSVIRPCCRFYPTCSQYSLDAIHTHSLLTAFFLIIRRILRCHPWHPGGIDLVPPKKQRKKI